MTVASVLGLLTACAAPSGITPSKNLTLEMRQLRSSLESQEQKVLNLSHQVTELEARLQRQAEEIHQLRQSPPQAQSGLLPGRTSQDFAATPAQGEGSATEIYLQAFGDYASGRYQKAIHGFETFLRRFPNNSYSSNAQYWLGDCYFNQQQYVSAIQEFERVLNNYPSAPKSPDAHLKIALAQLQLGETVKARQTINTLNQRYPKSTAAQKAQELVIP
ncbi:MAG: tol-pal system protein YbgF [Desulfuromonadales bacterium]|nr:tol-pal system protein YbgF [Desulfuromonadales bacterium]